MRASSYSETREIYQRNFFFGKELKRTTPNLNRTVNYQHLGVFFYISSTSKRNWQNFQKLNYSKKRTLPNLNRTGDFLIILMQLQSSVINQLHHREMMELAVGSHYQSRSPPHDRTGFPASVMSGRPGSPDANVFRGNHIRP